jgi:hypothetical protein
LVKIADTELTKEQRIGLNWGNIIEASSVERSEVSEKAEFVSSKLTQYLEERDASQAIRRLDDSDSFPLWIEDDSRTNEIDAVSEIMSRLFDVPDLDSSLTNLSDFSAEPNQNVYIPGSEVQNFI